MAIPPTFPAATLAAQGSRHTVTERSLAPLAADEVAIRITATAINPVDWKIRDHGIFQHSFPTVLGSDAAGEIVALGSDAIPNVAIGDRVFFQGIVGNHDSSTFQTYCKMPAALVAKTPSSVTDEQAAGISLATVAAATGLYDRTGRGLSPPWATGGDHAGRGKAIVVLGGSSSVGQYVIQLARLSGYERIVTSASQTHHEYLKALGANVVLDRLQATAVQYAAGAGGLPLDFVFDTISLRETQILGVEILQTAGAKEGSPVVTVLGPDADAQALNPKFEIHGVMGLGSAPHLRYLSEPLFAQLGGENGWVATGRYVPNRPIVVEGLAKVDEALDKNRAGVSGEKVVLRL